MPAGIDLNSLRFDEPEYLWLLIVPAVSLLVWVWRLGQRRRDVVMMRRRSVPVRERVSPFGDLVFWLCTTLAIACVIVALARPKAAVSVVRTAGADVVILQDGSASMYVEDVHGSRWERSMRFLRTLGESLRWEDDRVALAAFAHIAAPQLRLTRDPNTFLFFLDHLEKDSPFRLQDDTTWDTNLELGVTWGLRLIDKDEELHGRSSNAKVFVLVTDGQAWSGSVERPLQIVSVRNIPLFVVGVGSSTGGVIPPPKVPPTPPGLPPPPMPPYVPIRSSLDRASLAVVASFVHGQYFELDRDADRDIANRIIEVARQRAGTRGLQESAEYLHWRVMAVGAVFVALGVLALNEGAALWIQLAGTAAMALAVWSVVR